MLTIDVADPSDPTFLCTLPVGGTPVAIATSGGRIFVALKDAGLQVFHYSELVFADDFESGRSHHRHQSSF